MHDDGELLAGGNTSGPVLRIGVTVRKPWTAATGGVVEFMQFLRAAGVDLPAPLGRDQAGRQVLEYVPGELALHAPELTPAQLSRVGGMIRAVHDASEAFTPPSDARWQTAIPSPGDDLICHNDLAPWNLIIGDRWVFIDWDAAGPSTRLWDLAYAAQAFTLQDPARPAEHAAARLRAFVDGYQADGSMRDALPQAMVERAEAMVHLLTSSHENGREPWASMHRDGHGSHWSSVARYTDRHQSSWTRALSIDAQAGPASR